MNGLNSKIPKEIFSKYIKYNQSNYWKIIKVSFTFYTYTNEKKHEFGRQNHQGDCRYYPYRFVLYQCSGRHLGYYFTYCSYYLYHHEPYRILSLLLPPRHQNLFCKTQKVIFSSIPQHFLVRQEHKQMGKTSISKMSDPRRRTIR